MAIQARSIQAKIGAVENIGKITRAMELVSVSKMKRATASALSARPYAEHAFDLLLNIAKDESLTHRLLEHGDTKQNLIVIISSNKGLCGSFNVNVLKAATQFIKRVHKKHDTTIKYVTVGRRSEKMARKMGGDIVASFIDLPEHVTLETIEPIAQVIGEEFATGKYHNVVVVSTRYISALSNEVIARQVLPVKVENIRNMVYEEWTPADSEEFSNYLFEPSDEEVAKHILHELSVVQLYQALLESRASEHSMRMMAMRNATENAGRLADDLTLTYNRARQAGITNEIAEISSGAEALSP